MWLNSRRPHIIDVTQLGGGEAHINDRPPPLPLPRVVQFWTPHIRPQIRRLYPAHKNCVPFHLIAVYNWPLMDVTIRRPDGADCKLGRVEDGRRAERIFQILTLPNESGEKGKCRRLISRLSLRL